MKPLPLCLRCLVIACLVVCGRSAEAADNWLRLQSKDFELITNGSEAQMRRVARNLEEFRAAFALLIPAAGMPSSAGTTVIIFKDDSSFKPFMFQENGQPSDTSGYFLSRLDQNFITLDDDPLLYTPRMSLARTEPQAIYHELVHSLIHDSSNPLPLWLSEGLAEYYSTFEISANGRDITFGRAMDNHLRTLDAVPLLPLTSLLAVKRNSSYYNEKTRQGIFYAESWALVHYLMDGRNGRRQTQLKQYLGMIAKGQSIDESFQAAFQTSYTGMEEELRQYLKDRAKSPIWPLVNMTLDGQLTVDPQTPSEALSEAQSGAYLGGLLLRLSRLDDAEQQLQEAIRLDPGHSASYLSMAMLRARQNRIPEALDFAAKATQLDPQNAIAHYYYASLLQGLAEDPNTEAMKARWTLMKSHLKQSIDIAPRFIQSYRLMAYCSLVLNDEIPETEAMLERAAGYAPGHQELRIMLAQLKMANNKTSEAQAILTAMRDNSASPTILDEDATIHDRAAKLLDDIAAELQYEQSVREYEAGKTASSGNAGTMIPKVLNCRPERQTQPQSPQSPAAPTAHETALTLELVLSRASRYVEDYEAQLGSLIGEEVYVQDQAAVKTVVPRQQEQRTESDFAILQIGKQWIGLREVNCVDGKPVQRKAEDFQKALDGSPGAVLKALDDISRESAQYNIGIIARTTNLPTFALQILRTGNAQRFEFKKAGETIVDGTRTWALGFREIQGPTLIHDLDDHDEFANGTLWVEPETGHILKTEMNVSGSGQVVRAAVTNGRNTAPLTKATMTFRAQTVVSYRSNPALEMLVPARMEEHYDMNDVRSFDGRADYFNFHRFQVETHLDFGPPVPPGRRLPIP